MENVVGKNIPRLDGYDKVTGRTLYMDDVQIDGCWYGAVVRSPIPYGKIQEIVFSPKFDWKKVVTVTYKDIPGANKTIFLTDEQPILAEEYVRHVGEAIVLIAAPTKEMAEEAKKFVIIEFEELQPVLSIEESKLRSHIIWGKDNIQAHYTVEKGDIKAGFAEADHIVEGEYRTGFHEHAYIEPQGMAAIPRPDGGITVMGSLQCPYYVLKTMKSAFDIHEDKVNVVQTPMGGAFGGKEDYPSLLGPYCAFLAKKSGKPVKIIYSRDEDILVTTKRHPSIVRHKTGVKKDGTITALEVDIAFEGGAYTTLSPVVLSRGLIHSTGPYKVPNVSAKASCYATNNVPTGAFRGFGAPQTFFAIESHMDAVAEKIKMNPYELRLKNCVHLGDTLATSQLMRESVAAEKCLKTAVKLSDYNKKWKQNNQGTEAPRHRGTKKGIGLALYMHGGAFTGSGEAMMKTEAGLRLNKDGTVSVLTGCTDMGQGSHTVLPQIAAEALGVKIEHVNIVTPDTDVVPDSGPTVASRVTMVIGTVMKQCAVSFRKKLFEYVSDRYMADPSNLDIRNGVVYDGKKKLDEYVKVATGYFKKFGEIKVIERYALPSFVQWDAAKHKGDAYPAYSWAADVAEITVDTETFEVTVDKITMVVDVGRAVNPILVEGQMEGGTLQALGWGLIENLEYEKGAPKNNRLQTYIIPTVKDTPKWVTKIIEEPFSFGPYGAKGVGELPVDGGAPAIANAIFNAIGVRMCELPMSPEKIFPSFVRRGEGR